MLGEEPDLDRIFAITHPDAVVPERHGGAGRNIGIASLTVGATELCVLVDGCTPTSVPHLPRRVRIRIGRPVSVGVGIALPETI